MNVSACVSHEFNAFFSSRPAKWVMSEGIVNFMPTTTRMRSNKKTISRFLFASPLYAPHLLPVSFPHEEGVCARFFHT
jgi:hypothetical protein